MQGEADLDVRGDPSGYWPGLASRIIVGCLLGRVVAGLPEMRGALGFFEPASLVWLRRTSRRCTR